MARLKSNLKALLGAVESTKGTKETLVKTDDGKLRVRDLSFTINPARIKDAPHARSEDFVDTLAIGVALNHGDLNGIHYTCAAQWASERSGGRGQPAVSDAKIPVVAGAATRIGLVATDWIV